MPSKRAEPGRLAWLKKGAEAFCALALVALGWTHGVVFVEGGSMEPALYPGDVIVYRRFGVVPEAGEMIVFEHDGGLVVHRVSGKLRDGSLRMRGDANATLDATPVAPDDVRGEVLLAVPSGKVATRLAGLGD
ncbi:MAG: signal peptidase I [Actinobacteria bacterium]|nr:signal peptidase I [Actinomycetota bacterium]